MQGMMSRGDARTAAARDSGREGAGRTATVVLATSPNRTDARLQASAATLASDGVQGKSGIDESVCSSAPSRLAANGSGIRGKECLGSERKAGGCSSEASHGREFPGGTSRGRVNNHARRDLTAHEPTRSPPPRTKPCSTECPRPSALKGRTVRTSPPPGGGGFHHHLPASLPHSARPHTGRRTFCPHSQKTASEGSFSKRRPRSPVAPAARAPPLPRLEPDAGLRLPAS